MKGKGLVLKTITEISRVVLGATFVFSGFVKAADPMGTAYKIQDYFLAFGFPALSMLSVPLSILMCVGEFTLGAFMIVGLYRRVTSILMLLVMLFMTLLTFYLAVANPVSDCGCFGDFLVISNWQTFYKNLVLLACAAFLFFNFHRITNLFTGKFYWVVGIFTIFYIAGFSFYNCYYEPIFDFRPYKIGANLPKLMQVEDGKGDVYENIFIYEKDGVKKEFTETNYPWKDTTWIFVDRKTSLVKEGEKPVIHDFKIDKQVFSPDKTEIEYEEDITQEVLSDSGYVFFMIAYSLPETDVSHLSSFEDASNYAADHHYKFYCLTSSTSEDILKWEKENTFNFTYCKTDERTLKTIMRSNPGLLLLKNGTIINKWADHLVPQENTLIKPLNELDVNKTETVNAANERHFIYLVILFVLPLMIIKIFDFVIYQRRNKTIG